MAQVDAKTGWMPLTLPQLDFWEEFTLHPDQPLSTVAHCLELEGDIDERALVRAIRTTVRESEVLSMRFREGTAGEGPMQRCDPEQTPVLQQADLRGSAAPLAEAKRSMHEDLRRSCDLRTDKLSAQVLFRVGDRRYLWYHRAHHIVVDGYALALIERRCGQLYRHFCGRREAGPSFHPFAVFLAEEDAYRGSARWQADRDYWARYLDRTFGLPVLDKGGEDYGAPGRQHQLPLSDAVGSSLRRTAASLEMGWPDLLVLLSGVYLHHALPQWVDGDGVLTLWLPFMSRWGSVGAYLPAMLVNILPFHLSLAGDETLRTYLRRAACALRRQRTHGRYRIEQIAADRALGKGRRFFFSPLINVLPFMAPVFDGCQVTRHVLASGVGDGLNLTFRGDEDCTRLQLHLEADASLAGEVFERLRRELPGFIASAASARALERPVASLWDSPDAA